jgi:hypothetical protein
MSDNSAPFYNLSHFIKRYWHDAETELMSVHKPGTIEARAEAEATLTEIYRKATEQCRKLEPQSDKPTFYQSQFINGHPDANAKGNLTVYKVAEHDFAERVLAPSNSHTEAMHALKRQRFEHLMEG